MDGLGYGENSNARAGMFVDALYHVLCIFFAFLLVYIFFVYIVQ